MFGGAECSTGRNPLAQLSKIGGADTQQHQDRLHAAQGPLLHREGLRSAGMEAAAAEQNMMEFAQANNAFQFPEMHRNLDAIHQNTIHQNAIHQQPAGAGWIDEFQSLPHEQQAMIDPNFHAQQIPHMAPGLDVSEFAQFQHHAQQHQHVHQAPVVGPRMGVPVQSQFHRPLQGYRTFNGGGYSGAYQTAPMHLPPQPTQLEKGKGKVIALDDHHWEQQFAEMDQAEQFSEATANQTIDGELQGADKLFQDFENVWGDEETKMADIPSEWLNVIDSEKTWTPDISSTKSMPTTGDYMFEPENPYMTLDDPFMEGKRLLESGGNLSLAALSFEAAVQKDENHVEAWTLLGSCQAQNEKETPAIRALEHALELDPQNLAAMMGLAVSYTNEGYDTTAYAILERWISTKYPELTKDSLPTTTIERNALQERVTDLFIAAAQLSPDGEHMDSDVQVGLGVLFYGAEEYDKAVDCFNAALSFDYDARDKNHLLWNRLGATLANSGRSEEAINAYERALTINPNFTRARYNLGVSCINIGCFEQAAQHLLGALSMHKVAEDKAREDARAVGMDPDRIVHNQSTNLFDTLRRVFSQMGRTDLANRVNTGMDVDTFRAEFDF